MMSDLKSDEELDFEEIEDTNLTNIASVHVEDISSDEDVWKDNKATRDNSSGKVDWKKKTDKDKESLIQKSESLPSIVESISSIEFDNDVNLCKSKIILDEDVEYVSEDELQDVEDVSEDEFQPSTDLLLDELLRKNIEVISDEDSQCTDATVTDNNDHSCKNLSPYKSLAKSVDIISDDDSYSEGAKSRDEVTELPCRNTLQNELFEKNIETISDEDIQCIATTVTDKANDLSKGLPQCSLLEKGIEVISGDVNDCTYINIRVTKLPNNSSVQKILLESDAEVISDDESFCTNKTDIDNIKLISSKEKDVQATSYIEAQESLLTEKNKFERNKEFILNKEVCVNSTRDILQACVDIKNLETPNLNHLNSCNSELFNYNTTSISCELQNKIKGDKISTDTSINNKKGYLKSGSYEEGLVSVTVDTDYGFSVPKKLHEFTDGHRQTIDKIGTVNALKMDNSMASKIKWNKKKFDRIIIIGDSRLSSIKPMLYKNCKFNMEILSENNLSLDCLYKFITNNVIGCPYLSTSTLLVYSVGINDTAKFIRHKCVPKCTSLILPVPPDDLKPAFVAQSIMVKIKSLYVQVTDYLGDSNDIIFMPTFPIDLMVYHSNLIHIHKTSSLHKKIALLYTPKEACDASFKLIDILQHLSNLLMASKMNCCRNFPFWIINGFSGKQLFEFKKSLKAGLGTKGYFIDGYNPTENLQKNIIDKINQLCCCYLNKNLSTFTTISGKKFDKIILVGDERLSLINAGWPSDPNLKLNVLMVQNISMQGIKKLLLESFLSIENCLIIVLISLQEFINYDQIDYCKCVQPLKVLCPKKEMQEPVKFASLFCKKVVELKKSLKSEKVAKVIVTSPCPFDLKKYQEHLLLHHMSVHNCDVELDMDKYDLYNKCVFKAYQHIHLWLLKIQGEKDTIFSCKSYYDEAELSNGFLLSYLEAVKASEKIYEYIRDCTLLLNVESVSTDKDKYILPKITIDNTRTKIVKRCFNYKVLEYTSNDMENKLKSIVPLRLANNGEDLAVKSASRNKIIKKCNDEIKNLEKHYNLKFIKDDHNINTLYGKNVDQQLYCTNSVEKNKLKSYDVVEPNEMEYNFTCNTSIKVEKSVESNFMELLTDVLNNSVSKNNKDLKTQEILKPEEGINNLNYDSLGQNSSTHSRLCNKDKLKDSIKVDDKESMPGCSIPVRSTRNLVASPNLDLLVCDANYSGNEKQNKIFDRPPKDYRCSKGQFDKHTHNYKKNHKSYSKGMHALSQKTRSYSREKYNSRSTVADIAVKNLWEIHERECSLYRKNPSAHPDYKKEYNTFVQLFYSTSLNVFTESEFLCKWNLHWQNRIEEIFRESWIEKCNKCLKLLSANDEVYFIDESNASVKRKHDFSVESLPSVTIHPEELSAVNIPEFMTFCPIKKMCKEECGSILTDNISETSTKFTNSTDLSDKFIRLLHNISKISLEIEGLNFPAFPLYCQALQMVERNEDVLKLLDDKFKIKLELAKFSLHSLTKKILLHSQKVFIEETVQLLKEFVQKERPAHATSLDISSLAESIKSDNISEILIKVLEIMNKKGYNNIPQSKLMAICVRIKNMNAKTKLEALPQNYPVIKSTTDKQLKVCEENILKILSNIKSVSCTPSCSSSLYDIKEDRVPSLSGNFSGTEITKNSVTEMSEIDNSRRDYLTSYYSPGRSFCKSHSKLNNHILNVDSLDGHSFCNVVHNKHSVKRKSVNIDNLIACALKKFNCYSKKGLLDLFSNYYSLPLYMRSQLLEFSELIEKEDPDLYAVLDYYIRQSRQMLKPS